MVEVIQVRTAGVWWCGRLRKDAPAAASPATPYSGHTTIPSTSPGLTAASHRSMLRCRRSNCNVRLVIPAFRRTA